MRHIYRILAAMLRPVVWLQRRCERKKETEWIIMHDSAPEPYISIGDGKKQITISTMN